MKSKEKLDAQLNTGDILKLEEVDSERKLSGTSKNRIFQDATGSEYYLKEAKPRKAADIFYEDKYFISLKQQRKELFDDAIFNSYTELPDNQATLNKIKELSDRDSTIYIRLQREILKYVDHAKDLMFKNTFLEVLAASISTEIMGGLLQAPSDFLIVYKRSPAILSRSVVNFNEFLAERPYIRASTSTNYWLDHKTPSFIEMDLTEDEARILGQAYCTALIFGHNDVVNNINLSNFGYVTTKEEGLKLCIVDWGNSLGVGFNGLTADEGAFKNPQMIGVGNFFDNPSEATGFKNLMPFDEIVYPFLPRQVIPDLFNFTLDDYPRIRLAQRQGFYEACDQAVKALGDVSSIICNAVYQIKAIDYPPWNYSELSRTIEARIKSIQQLCKELKQGLTLNSIANERLLNILKSQMTSGLGFFNAPKRVDCCDQLTTNSPVKEPQLMSP